MHPRCRRSFVLLCRFVRLPATATLRNSYPGRGSAFVKVAEATPSKAIAFIRRALLDPALRPPTICHRQAQRNTIRSRSIRKKAIELVEASARAAKHRSLQAFSGNATLFQPAARILSSLFRAPARNPGHWEENESINQKTRQHGTHLRIHEDGFFVCRGSSRAFGISRQLTLVCCQPSTSC